MRGCQAPTGSRTDALAKQPALFHVRYGASTRWPAPTAGILGSGLFFPTPGCARQPLQSATSFLRGGLAPIQLQPCLASNSSSEHGPLSAEEEEAYQEFMLQRKAERKAWKLEVRRRAKFDPMAAPGPGAEPTAAALQALSRPKAPPAAKPGRLPQPKSDAAAASASGPASSSGGSPRIIDLAAAPQNSRRHRPLQGRRVTEEEEEEEEEEDGGLDVGGLAAMARKVLEDDDKEATATAVPVASGSSTRRSMPTAAAAAAAATRTRRPGATAPKRQLMPIAQLQRQRAAAAAAAASPPTVERDGTTTTTEGQDEDELDWEALQVLNGAYEKYEQYVNEVAEEEERAAARRAASAAATTSTSAAAAAAGLGEKVAGSDGPRRAAAAAAAAITSTSPDPVDKLDRQLDQWEQLINFFEVVERDGKREEARKRRRQAQAEAEAEVLAPTKGPMKQQRGKTTNSGAAAAASAAVTAVGGAGFGELSSLSGLRHDGDGVSDDEEAQGEVEVDWQSLERLFLGEGWEAELAELKARVEAGEQEAAATPGGKGPSEAEEEVESWRDEVSTLLLGLEERAAAFWEAPFLLLVQDDSGDPLVEYVNRSALSALGMDSFDEATAGLSAASLVDPTHPRSQQEWLWATTEAAERSERYATIPSLRLRGPGPGAPSVLCSDVTVFRVDSLEEQAIGQAVVARSWRQMMPGEGEGEGEGEGSRRV
ncbi:hypothetical protein VOLCADRAFT_86821 [Volvox carteri f. nagariensis]|uniref:MEKHLA domain-containing protein n=1 Tax=Volvox carteri f. nagariensis TaxID=3068 RepID=D8TJP5_VOLCA|nr:uncharacterized protein VOLCADRAFT_86821 [Volvox carteri f. nagariensis]EFJ52579.1 hypothetical protein VOLCADRAFT_86821 [Volvox carteri f. nagariensis]|eukprot:XP_002946652.1 hypothetical protein VOLCADRAFT_86821 [Volvox carteri f. nagariensis]